MSNIILVPVDGSQNDTPSLNTALALAKKLNGHIRALFARPNPEAVVRSFHEGFYPGAYKPLLDAIRQQWDDSSRKSQDRFDEWRKQNKIHALYEPDVKTAVSAERCELTGNAEDILQDMGQLADVIVMPRPHDRSDAAYYERFEAALLLTGRSVVLAPPRTRSHPALDKVLIAWNRKPQAARAVSTALPLLQQAAEVAIFTKSEGRLTQDSASVLVDYLRWHGVRASVFTGQKNNNSTPHAVLAAASKFHANLLVMGAYTHSRLRETIFGGVTLHVAAEATVPVWMTH